jgi:drug/metabolite transporter (DMT)-like permease
VSSVITQKRSDTSTTAQDPPVARVSLGHTFRRSAALLATVITLKPFSNLILTWGVRHISQALSINPSLFLRVLLDPLVALGVGMQIIWLLARMALLSIADLSFVLPITASGYVISTLLGRVFLHEQVTVSHWLGTFLIFAGTLFVGSTGRHTAPPLTPSPARN